MFRQSIKQPGASVGHDGMMKNNPVNCAIPLPSGHTNFSELPSGASLHPGSCFIFVWEPFLTEPAFPWRSAASKSKGPRTHLFLEVPPHSSTVRGGELVTLNHFNALCWTQGKHRGAVDSLSESTFVCKCGLRQ